MYVMKAYLSDLLKQLSGKRLHHIYRLKQNLSHCQHKEVEILSDGENDIHLECDSKRNRYLPIQMNEADVILDYYCNGKQN